MSKSWCPDCPPTRQLNHRHERVFDVLLSWASAADVIPPVILKKIEQAILRLFFVLMRGIGLLREGSLKADDRMQQRTRLVLIEAQKRGYLMARYYFGEHPTNFFLLKANGQEHLWEGLPGLDPRYTITNVDDKDAAKRLVEDVGAPVAEGETFSNSEPAVAYGLKLGFPLVVKPRHGSLSGHTTVNIQNEKELRQAIAVAQVLRRRFVVEQYIIGALYRATLVGGKLVACGRWEPPVVIGDGVQTIAELFVRYEKQRYERLLSAGYTVDPTSSVITEQACRDGTRVPAAGEVCGITWKVNFCAKMVDVTDSVQTDNTMLFERIAKAIDLSIVGIDFIAPDILVSYKEQRCAVIELNSMPAIDLHYPPIGEGETSDVAGALLDVVCSSDRKMV